MVLPPNTPPDFTIPSFYKPKKPMSLLDKLMMGLPKPPKTKAEKAFEDVAYQMHEHFEEPTEFLTRTLPDGAVYYGCNSGFAISYNAEQKKMKMYYSGRYFNTDAFFSLKEQYPELPYEIKDKTITLDKGVHPYHVNYCQKDESGFPIFQISL